MEPSAADKKQIREESGSIKANLSTCNLQRTQTSMGKVWIDHRIRPSGDHRPYQIQKGWGQTMNPQLIPVGHPRSLFNRAKMETEL